MSVACRSAFWVLKGAKPLQPGAGWVLSPRRYGKPHHQSRRDRGHDHHLRGPDSDHVSSLAGR